MKKCVTSNPISELIVIRYRFEGRVDYTCRANNRKSQD